MMSIIAVITWENTESSNLASEVRWRKSRPTTTGGIWFSFILLVTMWKAFMESIRFRYIIIICEKEIYQHFVLGGGRKSTVSFTVLSMFRKVNGGRGAVSWRELSIQGRARLRPSLSPEKCIESTFFLIQNPRRLL
jgi:hypothetical protein